MVQHQLKAISLSVSDINGGYSEWGEWGNCSVPCGNGSKSRERTCTNPEPQGEGKDCHMIGKSTDVMECKIKECPGKHNCDAIIIIIHSTKARLI